MVAYRHIGNNIYVGITTDTMPTPANTPNGALLFEFATDYSRYTVYVNDKTSWKSNRSYGTGVQTFSRQKLFDLGGTSNGLHITTTLSSGPATLNIFPKDPASLTDNVTSAAFYCFASDYAGDDLSAYDVLQIQSVKLSSTPGESAARYDIVSFKNLTGYLHPIYIGIQGQNKWIFNTDGSINANSLPISNFRLSSAGTADINSSVLNNVAGVRGVSTANSAYRANPNTTDATERSLIFQALNATSDVFIDVLKITPNGANPRATLDFELDRKTISAPADPASGYVREYPKAIDANNDAIFIKQKINGAVVEVRMS